MQPKIFSLSSHPLKKIPSKPGVYLFLNQEGKPLYVGKAANLKNRLGAYLGEKTLLDKKTRLLVLEAKKLKIIILPSEFEALLLEANLIKQFQSPYNTKLKDDKRYLTLKSPAKSIRRWGWRAAKLPMPSFLALIPPPKQSGFSCGKSAAFFLIAPAEFYLKNHASITRLIFAPPRALIRIKNQPLPIADKLAKLKNCSKAKAGV